MPAGSGKRFSYALLLTLFVSCACSWSVIAAQLSAPLAQASLCDIRLDQWKFQPDPDNNGIESHFAHPLFDDSKWVELNALADWQHQGYPNHHGIGWYRLRINVPIAWKGSKVIFHSEGIKEEYDLYINGQLIRHYGSEKIPVGGVPTEAELSSQLIFGQENTIAVRVMDHGAEGGVCGRTELKRLLPVDPYKRLLPEPILAAHPELVDLYWQTWRMAWQKMEFGDALNGFVPAYMEEGYSGLIFQWDSVFITMYGRYGRRLFPAMPTLDNFYRKQDPDGYIQRIYSKTTGRKVVEINPNCTMTNPPIFAWSEWDYYKVTGDKSRFGRVFPTLERYYNWIKAHQLSKFVPGMYWQTDWESGMDNMPRANAVQGGWIDMTLQQALSAKYLSLIAHEMGNTVKEQVWKNEYQSIKNVINRRAWSEKDGIYYDVDRFGHFTGVRHIGAFWALIADVADKHQAERLVAHLKDPKEFYRKHLFPALSASDPGYTPEASYWQGGVWAPTDYMTIRGLAEYGYDQFAQEAALNHLTNMAAVYSSNIDTAHIDPNEADGDYRTIWECYNPDKTCPCTRADKFYYGRQDFAGWTGIGPISLLIEQVIGLDIVGSRNRVVWRLPMDEPGRVGLKNFELGSNNLVDLIAEPAKDGKRVITSKAARPFFLQVKLKNRAFDLKVPAGKGRFVLPM